MAVTNRQPDSLPCRIAKSAKVLASSTLSSVVGIEASLKRSRQIAKLGITSQTDCHHSDVQTYLLAPNRIAEKAFGSKEAASSSHALEEDFCRFQERTGLAIFEHEVLGDLLVDERDSNRSCMAVSDILNEDVDRSIGLALYPELQLQQLELTCQQSSAIRRLELLNAHVNAMRIEQLAGLQQRSEIANHLCREAFHDQPYQSLQQSLNHQPCDSEQMYQTPQVQFRSECSNAGNDEDLRPFYCPYYEFHNNFFWRNTLGLRPPLVHRCPHAGCDYISRLYSDWLHHVLIPHHDIQGFANVPDGHGSND